MTPSDIQLLEVGDRVYSVISRVLGNTAMRAPSVFDVVITNVHRDGNGRLIYVDAMWNGNKATSYSPHALAGLKTYYPVLRRHPIYDRNDDTYVARVERDKRRNAEDKKRWQEKRKAARAKKKPEVPR